MSDDLLESLIDVENVARASDIVMLHFRAAVTKALRSYEGGPERRYISEWAWGCPSCSGVHSGSLRCTANSVVFIPLYGGIPLFMRHEDDDLEPVRDRTITWPCLRLPEEADIEDMGPIFSINGLFTANSIKEAEALELLKERYDEAAPARAKGGRRAFQEYREQEAQNPRRLPDPVYCAVGQLLADAAFKIEIHSEDISHVQVSMGDFHELRALYRAEGMWSEPSPGVFRLGWVEARINPDLPSGQLVMVGKAGSMEQIVWVKPGGP